jgi:hypothetical protein
MEGLDDTSKAWRIAAEGIIVDDACIVEVGSCPQVVCVDGIFGYQHEASLDEC